MGKNRCQSSLLLNTEYKKVNKQTGGLEPDCREMREERILEKLSSDSFKES